MCREPRLFLNTTCGVWEICAFWYSQTKAAVYMHSGDHSENRHIERADEFGVGRAQRCRMQFPDGVNAVQFDVAAQVMSAHLRCVACRCPKQSLSRLVTPLCPVLHRIRSILSTLLDAGMNGGLAMRPSLPPVPSELRQVVAVDSSPPASQLQSQKPLKIRSPRPLRPAGGAVDTRTTLALERAASANLSSNSSAVVAAGGGRGNSDTMQAGPSSSAVNPRVASWVASSGSQPGFAACVNSARASTPMLSGSAPGIAPVPGPGPFPTSLPVPAAPPTLSLPPSQAPLQRASYAPSSSQTASQPQSRASSYTMGMADPRQNQQQQQQYSLSHSVSGLSLGNGDASTADRNGRSSTYGLDPSSAHRSSSPSRLPGTPTSHPHSRRSSLVPSTTPDPTVVPPTLCIALPSQADLLKQREAAAYSASPAAARVSWSKAVLKFVERHQVSSTNEFGKITDPVLVRWTDEAIRNILSSADLIPPVPEALYFRGELSNSGKFPTYRSKDSAAAFRDFEAAANAGYFAAWAKIALAYETFGEQNNSQADYERAKKAYEEGIRRQEVTCIYVGLTGFPI